MIKILFVCHGNICRSPMAEFVMKDMLEKARLEDDIEVESAATSREEIGNDTHYGTKRMLDLHGISYSRRRARQITVADYDEFDYIICMDDMNIGNVRRVCGEDCQEKVFKLMDFAHFDDPLGCRLEGRDVADPWYTGNFEETFADVMEGCKGLLSFLKERLC